MYLCTHKNKFLFAMFSQFKLLKLRVEFVCIPIIYSYLLTAQSASLIAMGQNMKHVSVRNQYLISFSTFHSSGPSLYMHRTDHTFLYAVHAQVFRQSFCEN